MLKIGITGGIGSGKTLICRVLQMLGVPVFYADEEVKLLYNHDNSLRNYLTTRFGTDICHEGQLRTSALAQIVFSNGGLLAELNAQVYPLLWRRFELFSSTTKNHMAVMEAAMLCESGFHKKMDKVVNVVAPEDVRMARILRRSTTITEREVLQRMLRQWTDEERSVHADFIINNDGKTAVIPQILTLIRSL